MKCEFVICEIYRKTDFFFQFLFRLFSLRSTKKSKQNMKSTIVLCIILLINQFIVWKKLGDMYISVKWCVISDGENTKCLEMAGAMNKAGITPEMQCVQGVNAAVSTVMFIFCNAV